MKTVKTATVMHNGWEMDNEAWVKRDNDGDLHLISTSHGRIKNMSLEQLDLKIKETQNSVDELNALRVLIV
jgi:hypothetical protein